MTATTVENLRRTLRLAACFADDPDESPFPDLGAVYIEAGGGILTATATDRYKLGHARTSATGDFPETGALVSVDRVRWICDGLGNIPGDMPVQLGVEASVGGVLTDRLTIATDRLSLAVPTVKGRRTVNTTPVGVRNGWVDYRKLFQPFSEATASTGQVLLAPHHLAVLAKVDKIVRLTCSRWTVIGPHQPVRVEIDTVLTALFMPINNRKEADHQSIPVGLPELAGAGVQS